MLDEKSLVSGNLTPKMEAFSQGCVDPENTETGAYRLAYNTKNMSANCVNNEASRLARLPKVAARIQELRDAVQELALVTKADILTELKGIGFGNLADLAEWNGRTVTLKNSGELPAEVTALVSEVSETKQGVRIKMFDKLDALDKMAKMTGVYKEAERPPGVVKITSVVYNFNHGPKSEGELPGTVEADSYTMILPSNGDEDDDVPAQ